MSDRTEWARSLIEQIETSNPGIVQLATLASLAVRIEPELLRSLRLALAPGLSAAAEADLWFSPLVRSRGPDGIVIVPEVAAVLRKRLARETLRRAWAITEGLHRHASPALRLEEKCAWLALSGRPDWKEQVEEELSSALRALLTEKRSGVARWALRALPQLPEEVRQTSAAWMLKLATEQETGRRVQLEGAPPSDLFEADLSEILTGMAEVELGVKREGDELLLGEVDGEGAFAIPVPDTDPRLIEVRWEVWREKPGGALGTAPLGAGPISGGMLTRGEERELISVPAGKVVRRGLGGGAVYLRTPSGAVYQLDSATPQPVELRLPSKTERAILRFLFENRDRYLRRGEIQRGLRLDRLPTPARVGQILADLHHRGLVLRIQGSASDHPQRTFYALSPMGAEFCKRLGFESPHPDSEATSGRLSIPRPRDPFFTGREELLSRIFNEFEKGTETPVVLLLGPLGVGKTALATEFVYRFASRYSRIAWIQGDQGEGYEDLVRWMANVTAFSAEELLLLIFDDRSEPLSQFAALKSPVRKHVLVTAETQSFQVPESSVVVVPSFSLHEAATLLGMFVDNFPDSAYSGIIEKLISSTAALRFAASYLGSTREDPAKYLEELKVYQGSTAGLFRAGWGQDPAALVVGISFYWLRKELPDFSGFVVLYAWLKRELSVAELLQGRSAFSGPVSRLLEDPELLQPGLEAAVRLNLLAPEVNGAFPLDPLVRRMLPEILEDHELLPWIKTAPAFLEQLDLTLEAASAWYQLGESLRVRSPLEALESLERSCNLFERVGDRPGLASALYSVGVLLSSIHRFEESIPRLQRSYRIWEELGNQVGVAASYHQLGLVAQDVGDYQEAMVLYKNALKINEELGNMVAMADSYHNLGLVTQHLNLHEEALKWHRRSLEINEGLGDRSRLADSYYQLGALEQDLDRYQEATAWYRKSIEIAEELGDRTLVAVSLSSLGNVAEKMGRYEEALGYYQQAVEMSLTLQVPSQVALRLLQLGTLYQKLGRSSEAIEALQQSCQLLEEAGSPAIVEGLKVLREALLSMGRHEEAAEVLRRRNEIVHARPGFQRTGDTALQEEFRDDILGKGLLDASWETKE